jgi:hypothetical protein
MEATMMSSSSNCRSCIGCTRKQYLQQQLQVAALLQLLHLLLVQQLRLRLVLQVLMLLLPLPLLLLTVMMTL